MICVLCGSGSGDCKEYFVYTARQLYSFTREGTMQAACEDFVRHSFPVCKTCRIRHHRNPLLFYLVITGLMLALWFLLVVARDSNETFTLVSGAILFVSVIGGGVLLSRYSFVPKIQAMALAARRQEAGGSAGQPKYVVVAESLYRSAQSGAVARR